MTTPRLTALLVTFLAALTLVTITALAQSGDPHEDAAADEALTSAADPPARDADHTNVVLGLVAIAVAVAGTAWAARQWH